MGKKNKCPMKKVVIVISSLLCLFACKKDKPTQPTPANNTQDSVNVTFNFKMYRGDTLQDGSIVGDLAIERFWSSLYNSYDHFWYINTSSWKKDSNVAFGPPYQINYISPDSFKITIPLRKGDTVNVLPGIEWNSLSGKETVQMISSSGYNSQLYYISKYPLVIGGGWHWVIK